MFNRFKYDNELLWAVRFIILGVLIGMVISFAIGLFGFMECSNGWAFTISLLNDTVGELKTCHAELERCVGLMRGVVSYE